MRTLADNFSNIFPSLCAAPFAGKVCVCEPNNYGTGKLESLEYLGIDGYVFPHELASKLSGFANVSGHNGILTKDCDGIFLCEIDGQKCIFFSELKSTFSSGKIWEATQQIMASCLKFIGVATTIQGFDISEYKMIGLIASFEPTQEAISAISKCISHPDCAFSIQLNEKKKKEIAAKKGRELFQYLNVPDVTFYYIPVEGRKSSFSISLPTLFSNSKP